jgi:phosphatidylserine/phosphatidylglycerophosphate/cardiolipin synthase-like enzyme
MAEATNRRTEQVLLDLIEHAERSLILVTYSAYKVPRLVSALRAALDRGVSVTLILESPEKTQALRAFRLLSGGIRLPPPASSWGLTEAASGS